MSRIVHDEKRVVFVVMFAYEMCDFIIYLCLRRLRLSAINLKTLDFVIIRLLEDFMQAFDL